MEVPLVEAQRDCLRRKQLACEADQISKQQKTTNLYKIQLVLHEQGVRLHSRSRLTEISGKDIVVTNTLASIFFIVSFWQFSLPTVTIDLQFPV